MGYESGMKGRALAFERVFMRKQLLKGVHVHLAGRGQHGSVDVPEALQGSKVFRQSCVFFNFIHLMLDIGPLPASSPGENIHRSFMWMVF
jgi:hypothetical protein